MYRYLVDEKKYKIIYDDIQSISFNEKEDSKFRVKPKFLFKITPRILFYRGSNNNKNFFLFRGYGEKNKLGEDTNIAIALPNEWKYRTFKLEPLIGKKDWIFQGYFLDRNEKLITIERILKLIKNKQIIDLNIIPYYNKLYSISKTTIPFKEKIDGLTKEQQYKNKFKIYIRKIVDIYEDESKYNEYIKKYKVTTFDDTSKIEYLKEINYNIKNKIIIKMIEFMNNNDKDKQLIDITINFLKEYLAYKYILRLKKNINKYKKLSNGYINNDKIKLKYDEDIIIPLKMDEHNNNIYYNRIQWYEDNVEIIDYEKIKKCIHYIKRNNKKKYIKWMNKLYKESD